MEDKIKRILKLKCQEKQSIIFEIQKEKSLEKSYTKKINQLQELKNQEIILNSSYDISFFLEKKKKELISIKEQKRKSYYKIDNLALKFKNKFFEEKRLNNFLNKISEQKNKKIEIQNQTQLDEWFYKKTN